MFQENQSDAENDEEDESEEVNIVLITEEPDKN